ncbi:MAG: 50S ribosomal protein L20 [Patescibacteria group bacterium]|nr:50S ribosomal protein L20 [Patescibacteria group bacterium]MDD5715685.1 50S ribosomal protein L20 [Patescibacteria group bacterium]
MRVKRGTQHVKRRRNILKKVKGYRWGRKNKIKRAQEAIRKAGAHAYNDRRKKKGNFRALWNIKINAGVRQHGMTYSTFMKALKDSKINLNRKMLAELAEFEPKTFEALVQEVKK